jgi:DNA-binding GntR family transcriptional regulator
MNAGGNGAGDPDDVSVASVKGSVRTAILTGEYGPNHRLVEADLCDQLGASRFIVRAALQDLAGDGLVEMQRNKGARVRAVSLDEALEIVEVRQALEGLAAGRAARLVDESGIADLEAIGTAMRQAVESAELLAYSELNARLHATIQAIAGNQTCTRVLDRLQGQVVRHQFALSLRPGRPTVSLQQHLAIIDAIGQHDATGAEAAMREHLQSVTDAMRSTRT